MAQINITNLTFCYEGSYDNIFENSSFQMDTDWKLGLIGRNGKGKTTLLRLLLGQMEYQGKISSSVPFDYFPYDVKKEWMQEDTIEVLERLEPMYELWKVCRELESLETDAELLYRPFGTLSHGERTKVMLALLFSKDNFFLLIDEPTNHLDMETRRVLRDYLNLKKGFLLVSHDSWLLDECVDHVLILNRNTISVEKGNFSSWWENKQRRDAFELSENEKIKQKIDKLEEAAKRTKKWADKVESTKIGFDPIKEHDRCLSTRSYIAARTKALQQQRKNMERRQQSEMEAQKDLLKDLETVEDLKLMPKPYRKERCISIRDFGIVYRNDNNQEKKVFEQLQLEIRNGDRTFLQGKNGCGKSSLIKSILQLPNIVLLNEVKPNMEPDKIQTGILEAGSGLTISYLSQDTSFLKGKLDDYIEKLEINGTILKSILKKLDFERVQYEKEMQDYSEGQKKKVLLAGSLLQSANLYIWDEPLNYIDIFSRMQIEQLILKFKPTMLIVEHDRTFVEKIATNVVRL